MRYNEGILRSLGFVLHDARQVWIHRDRRKAFSHRALREHDPGWLNRKLAQNVPEQEFRFYRHASDPPVCHEILGELGLGHLVAVERLDN